MKYSYYWRMHLKSRSKVNYYLDLLSYCNSIPLRISIWLQFVPNSFCFRDVRKSCLWNIILNNQTLPFVLKRLRDQDSSVRKTVFQRLTEEFSTLKLSQDQKILIINGLFDRDLNVKKVCLKLVCEVWIGEVGGDLFKVIHNLWNITCISPWIHKVLAKLEVDDDYCCEAVLKAYLLANSGISYNYDGSAHLYHFNIIDMRPWINLVESNTKHFIYIEMLHRLLRWIKSISFHWVIQLTSL